ncbi:MAG: hypothetical protein ACR2O0_08570, partial [Rhizobiaceae bacterium]
PKSIAKELTSQFPVNLFDPEGDNDRMDLSSSEIKERNDIPECWRKFIEYQSSQDFLNEFIEIFGDQILQLHPKLYRSKDALKKLVAGRRFVDSFDGSDVLVDALISVNTPAKSMNSVRQAHVDGNKKLFSGLYYVRRPQDDSEGGNLLICKWKNGYSSRDKLKYYKEGLEENHFDVVEEIKYDNNVAVLFLNSMDALHSITPRNVTKHYRTFANLIGDVNHKLYVKQPWYSMDRVKKKAARFRKKYLGAKA